MPIDIHFVTANEFKVQENNLFQEHYRLPDGSLVKDQFHFHIQAVSIRETLEVDIERMVAAEVQRAYHEIRVPCVVEHAGLIFEEYVATGFPGGLTKPMWDSLGKNFVKETNSAGRRAIARSWVAFCDGMSIRTFSGETLGSLATEPRGRRSFYWDTVFIPDDPSCKVGRQTYAEIVDDPKFKLEYKVTELSQSSKAMAKLLMHIKSNGYSSLWATLPRN